MQHDIQQLRQVTARLDVIRNSDPVVTRNQRDLPLVLREGPVRFRVFCPGFSDRAGQHPLACGNDLPVVVFPFPKLFAEDGHFRSLPS